MMSHTESYDLNILHIGTEIPPKLLVFQVFILELIMIILPE